VRKIRILTGALLVLGVSSVIQAASPVIQIGETGVSYPVTDFGAILLQDQVTGADAGTPYEVEVTLKIVPGIGVTMFAADFLVDLRHNTGSSLNDPLGTYRSLNLFQDLAATADSLGFGSVANGIEIRLKDSYPLRLRDYADFNSTAPLIGNWQAYEALDPLGQMDPNGVWGLFVSDTSIGGAGVVTEWTVTLKPVPEPGSGALLGLGLGALFVWRRARRQAV